jgi:hypothetical protein
MKKRRYASAILGSIGPSSRRAVFPRLTPSGMVSAETLDLLAAIGRVAAM